MPSAGSLQFVSVPYIRASASLIVDEIKWERAEVKSGHPDELGWWSRVAWTVSRHPLDATVIVEHTHLDTYTYQHRFGYTNFVNRGKLLGHPLGNDAAETKLGARMIFPKFIMLELDYGFREWGDNSLLLDDRIYTPYTEHHIDHFPSGKVRTNRWVGIQKTYCGLYSHWIPSSDGMMRNQIHID